MTPFIRALLHRLSSCSAITFPISLNFFCLILKCICSICLAQPYLPFGSPDRGVARTCLRNVLEFDRYRYTDTDTDILNRYRVIFKPIPIFPKPPIPLPIPGTNISVWYRYRVHTDIHTDITLKNWYDTGLPIPICPTDTDIPNIPNTEPIPILGSYRLSVEL